MAFTPPQIDLFGAPVVSFAQFPACLFPSLPSTLNDFHPGTLTTIVNASGSQGSCESDSNLGTSVTVALSLPWYRSVQALPSLLALAGVLRLLHLGPLGALSLPQRSISVLEIGKLGSLRRADVRVSLRAAEGPLKVGKVRARCKEHAGSLLFI